MSSSVNGKTRILLFSCGSFNPITNMHLRIFELARDFLHKTGQFQVVGGIISPVNDAYKKKDLISAGHRCEMVNVALKTSDWIKLDCWESDQEEWTQTAQVLEHHQNILDSIINSTQGSTSKKQKLDVNLNCTNILDSGKDWDLAEPVRIMLLCGADLLESFNVPNLWPEEDITRIVGKHGLVVVKRESYNPEKMIYESDLLTKYQNNILIVTEWITNEISSTKIRRALKRGNSVKYLIPDAVLHYIKDQDLYSSKNKYPITFPELSNSNAAYYENLWDEMYAESEQGTAV